MERYIIPFEFKEKWYYVFITKDDVRQLYLVGKILPFTEEVYSKEINFKNLTQAGADFNDPRSFGEAIVYALHRFLHSRGWIVSSN